MLKNFKTKKSLGQCFLTDDAVHERIISSANLDPEKDIVVEIGPGTGLLTKHLVNKVEYLYAVELDADTVEHLSAIQKQNPNFIFKRGDFLRTELKDLIDENLVRDIIKGKRPKAKIVANIPYQITSKILVHLLGEIGEKIYNRDLISDIYIMVQKEYAERLSASPGTKAYGAITLLVGYWAEVEYLFDVPNTAFKPRPKVDSAFIRIRLRDKPGVEVKDPKALRRFIKAVFANRRKILSNALKAAGYDKDLVDSLKLGNLRGETLSLEEMADFLINFEFL